MEKISVVGAGGWGTALAVLAGKKGLKVNLWARRKELVEDILAKRENKQYLPGIRIPDNVFVTGSLQEAIDGGQIIILAVPSQHFRDAVKKIGPYLKCQIIISATKGIEQDTGKRMSEVVEEELGKMRFGVLSGPNHAKEVSVGLPTAAVVASDEKVVCKQVADCLSTDFYKIYPLRDVIGVEICGALKNIAALAIGVCDGLALGDNAKASIVCLGLLEMNNLGRVFGAKRSTICGLAGVGDLVATCYSSHSRNRFFGECLAKGMKIGEILDVMGGMVAEGVPTTKACFELRRKLGVVMPLSHQMYRAVYENKNINEAVGDLMKNV